MNRRYIHTLIALAVLACLWGAFVFVNRKKSKEAAAESTPAAKKILSVDRSHITSFTLKPQDGPAIVCDRQNKTWTITQPQKLPTDPTAVDGFLNSLSDASVDQVVAENPSNLKEYGLEPPQETVSLATNSKPKKITLLLGDATPTNGGVYAQLEGQPRVILLASYLKDSLEKNLFDLRDKSLTSFKSDQIQQIQAAWPKGGYKLVKNPDGFWDLMLPPPVRADHFTVEGLVDELGNVKMQSVVEEKKRDLGKYGFSRPTLTLHLVSGSGTQTLMLGKRQGDNYYAMNTAKDEVFTVGSDFLTQFQKTASDLRAKDLFGFSTLDANKILVDGPKGHEEFDQNKDKWEQSQPVSKAEPADKVEALLDSLRDLSAVSFPGKNPTDLARYGLNKPDYTFKVVSGDKNKTETVQIAEKGGHIYARRSTDVVPSELSKEALDPVKKALAAL